MFARRIFKFELGASVRDNVTGFTGTITARTEFHNGCIRYGTEAIKDFDIKECWFDEDRLSLVTESVREEPLVRTGGPRTAPPRTGH